MLAVISVETSRQQGNVDLVVFCLPRYGQEVDIDLCLRQIGDEMADCFSLPCYSRLVFV